MYIRHRIGRLGEDIAVNYLKNKGYNILERNFTARHGEIDIIAEDKDEIVFIEVKSRTSLLYGTPIEAVDHLKKKHLKSVINYYLYKHKLENNYIRIDIIEVYFKDGYFKLNHIKKIIL